MSHRANFLQAVTTASQTRQPGSWRVTIRAYYRALILWAIVDYFVQILLK